MFNRSLTYGASAAAILLATSGAAFAQETTGGVRGTITDGAGVPVANATVIITHTPSGTSNTVVTGNDGGYYARNLRVGGPYTVSVSSSQGSVEGVLPSIGIGTPGVLNLTVQSGASEEAYAVADIVVRGVRSGGLQTGPRTRVNAEQIETLPSISRDIKDFARTSPFASVDSTNNDALVLGGQNSRSNAFMVDGTRQSDDFGLAANGYPTVNSPISVSVLEAVQVDVAPYDVQYGNFQGGVINSVTKSGGNEFRGEVFYETTSDSMQGDTFSYEDMTTGQVNNRTVSGDFEETTWGATISGPIIKDRLFFVANYEEFEAVRPVLTGPSGSGATNEVPGITQADVDAVRDITRSVYGYDPLDWKADQLTTFDEKIFLKLDWNINDMHRAVVSYQQTEGSTLNLNGTSTSNSTPSLGLLSQGYEFQTNLVSYKAQLFSDWTENFSTEFSYTRKEAENITSNLAGSDFAAVRVYLDPAGFDNRSIMFGPERSRHANQLTNDLDQFRLVGKYQAGNHRLTFGYERENLEIYNVFVQAANAEYEFASLADFEAGRASYINYQNAGSNNKIDGGAAFGYSTNVLFAQDEFELNDRLTLRAGLRFDWYEMDDQPLENAAFEQAYGFKNTHTLDGISQLQPRFGFNYRVDDTFQVYGGFGLFLGGSPNVWVSNNFTNTGNLIGQFSCRADGYTSNNARSARVCSAEEMAALQVTDGTNPAQIAKDRVTESAALGTGAINVIDPTFDMPSIWKFSLGATKDFDLSRWNLGEGWNVRTEYVHSEVENAVGWIDLNMANNVAGEGPDGRPIYSEDMTNQNVLMLTNFKGGDTDQFTIGVNKNWYEGWAEGLGFDLSYTYVDSNDVHPGTSSVASSNYGQMAVFDPNNPDVATSNYEIKHSTKLNLSYRRAFFGDYRTSFNLFGERRSGLPYSHTISNSGAGINGEMYSSRNRSLLYVPTPDASGVVTANSDPLVTYGAGFDFDAFNNYLQQTGLLKYAGQAAPRNSSKSPDVTKFDLRIAQELPAFFPNGARLEAYVDIENLGNLLNDEWGVIQQMGFPYFSRGVTGTVNRETNQFHYTGYRDWTANGNYNNQSVWQVKVGVRYKF